MKVLFTTTHAPIELPDLAELSRELTALNSPVLFGCRTGICGTCLCEVRGDVEPASKDERELLDFIAPERPKARLACQVRGRGVVVLHYLGRN